MSLANIHDFILFTVGFATFLWLKATCEGKTEYFDWVPYLLTAAIILLIYPLFVIWKRPYGRSRLILFVMTDIVIVAVVDQTIRGYWDDENRSDTWHNREHYLEEHVPFSFFLGVLSLIFTWNIINILRWWGLRSLHKTCRISRGMSKDKNNKLDTNIV